MSISTEYYKKYKIYEENFAKSVENYGFKHRKANEIEDISEHWDVLIENGDINLKIDVKSKKKIARTDSSTQENYHWVEIKNVHGNDGWCYSDFNSGFAFELTDYWIYVDKFKLRELLKNKVKKEIVNDPYQAFYKLYRRVGRKDVLTLVNTIDLLCLANIIFKK